MQLGDLKLAASLLFLSSAGSVLGYTQPPSCVRQCTDIAAVAGSVARGACPYGNPQNFEPLMTLAPAPAEGEFDVHRGVGGKGPTTFQVKTTPLSQVFELQMINSPPAHFIFQLETRAGSIFYYLDSGAPTCHGLLPDIDSITSVKVIDTFKAWRQKAHKQ